MHSDCRWNRSTNWNLKMTPHLAERLFRWHLNITSDCTEQVNKIHSQQVSKELEVIRLIWVLSHLYRLSLYSSIKYTISLKKESKKLSSVSLSLLNFWAWQGESTQGHSSASSIPGARRQEASWEQITPWPDFSHWLARAAEWEWGQMQIADKSLQQIPILSS